MVKTATKKSGAGKKPLSRSLRMYQRIAVGFVIGTFLLLLVVLYLSISRATIIVVPNPKVVSATTPVKVVPKPVNEGEMSGIVAEETFTQAKTFTLSSDKGTPVEQKAGGLVTLINKTNSPQPLVATTRLLSGEGILFRIDETTSVPAGGQIEVMARADKPGLSGEVGPTQFTIPGLPTSLQDDIYAVSVDSMVGGVAYIQMLSEQDLNDAVNSLTEEMTAQAKTRLATGVDRSIFDGEAYNIEVLERKSDTQPGTETGSFTVSVTANIAVVYYSTLLLNDHTRQELTKRLPSGYGVNSVSPDGVQVTVESADQKSGTAELSVYLDGTSVLQDSAEVFSKDRFVGRSPHEVTTLLSASEGVKSSSVTFTPFWLKRVPTLKDHISIKIEEVKE